MRLLAVECCELEGLGLYEPALRSRGVEIERFPAYDPTAMRPELGDFDAMMVGGTPVSAVEVMSHPALGRVWTLLVAARDLPTLGICCGAQLLAQARGGSVYRGDAMEIGIHQLVLTDVGASDPMTAGFPARFPAFQWHGYGFRPPPGVEPLVAGSDRAESGGPLFSEQMFRAGRSVGLLFHLEVTAEAAGEWAETYADEAAAAGLDASHLVDACHEHADEMAALADQLVHNFVSLARMTNRGDGGTP